MKSQMAASTSLCHIVAVPHPGRGHVNSMMQFCKSLSSCLPKANNSILITLVVTEEWKSLIISEHSIPTNIKLNTIPNVLPSEHSRGLDYVGFFQAVMTKMKDPFEVFLDSMSIPVTIIIADIMLRWVVPVSKQRNIPVAILWPMSASCFSEVLHRNQVNKNENLPLAASEHGEKHIQDIPGDSSARNTDLPGNIKASLGLVSKHFSECFSRIGEANYLLINTVYELKSQVIDSLKAKLPLTIYPIGPAIPVSAKSISSEVSYMEWLDSKPTGSVLYISLGSFLHISSAQMAEIVAGVCESGVIYFWACRQDDSWFKQSDGSENGFVVPWCDQPSVLMHSAVGGFFSHCGWNSTLESVYSGVPLLTFPISFDQPGNSKKIVEDWKIGWHVKTKEEHELITREEIAGLVRKFMDPENKDVVEMRQRARSLQQVCKEAIEEGGSSINSLCDFLSNISCSSTKKKEGTLCDNVQEH